MNRLLLATLIAAACGTAAAGWFGHDRQINDTALDSVQVFDGTRPFVNTTNADATLAAYGTNLVSVFRTSGAKVGEAADGSLFVERDLRIGYATSNNGGLTWRSATMPPLPGSTQTLGSGTVDVDRRGRFFAAGISADANGTPTIAVNRSVDGGRTFAPAVAVDADGPVRRPWLAIGPDPARRDRDNVYVTWTRFAGVASSLRFAKSTDGGATFTTRTIFAPGPDPDQSNPQDAIAFSRPVVDPWTGKLYVAFLQFGNVAQDYLRIHVSEDGGETFTPLRFNLPGAPNPEVYPVVQPGTLTECSATRFDPPGGGAPSFFSNWGLTLHTGPDVGGSSGGLPRYVNASQVVLQPALAVSKGVIHLAWSNSTSPVFGDPASRANVLYVRSDNDGATWTAPLVVNAGDTESLRAVTPTIALGRFPGETALPFLPSPRDVHIGYYAQRADDRVVVKLAHSRDRGRTFPAALTQTLSSEPMTLAPTNIPLPSASNPFQTTNYNRFNAQCASVGDYAGIVVGLGTVHAAWGDSRHTVRQPVHPLDPISGQVHAKEDVFHAAMPIP